MLGTERRCSARLALLTSLMLLATAVNDAEADAVSLRDGDVLADGIPPNDGVESSRTESNFLPEWDNYSFNSALNGEATIPPLTFSDLREDESFELDGMLSDFEYFDDQQTPVQDNITFNSIIESAVDEPVGVSLSTPTLLSLNDTTIEQDEAKAVNESNHITHSQDTSASKTLLLVDKIGHGNSVTESISPNVNEEQPENTLQNDWNVITGGEESYVGFSRKEDPLILNDASIQNDEAILDDSQNGEAHWNTDLHNKINNIFNDIVSMLLLNNEDKSLSDSSVDIMEKPIGTLPSITFDLDDTSEKYSEDIENKYGKTESKEEADSTTQRVQTSFEVETTPVSGVLTTETVILNTFSSGATTEKTLETKISVGHEINPKKEKYLQSTPHSEEGHVESLKENPDLEETEENNRSAASEEDNDSLDNSRESSEGDEFKKSYFKEDVSEKKIGESSMQNSAEDVDNHETSDIPIEYRTEEINEGTEASILLNDAPRGATSELLRLGYRFGLPPDPKAIAEAEALLCAAGEGVLGDEAVDDDMPASTAPSSSTPSVASEGVSLAFVFDYTGSMHDDLMAVMAGTQAILKTMMEDENKPIYNYVLVPFHDPKVGPLTVTTNHTLFNNSIKAISVHGGGDCPENALGGIKMALEASLPRSFIYVFTDASAKDVDLLKEVVPLIQRKKSQVVFVLTGDCNDTKNIRYLVYEKIADVSSGQVFHLNKSDVDEVLKFVKLSLQTRRVNLLSVTKPGPSQEEHSLLVDGSLDDFTVAVAGTNAEIDVKDPAGRAVEKPQLQPVLDLSNVKVVKVENPDPGRWTVKTSSTSQHSVRSTGTSLMDFQFGFSVAPVANLHQTFHRPLKGTPNHILIKATESEGLHNLTYLRLVNLNGTIVHEVGLLPIDPDDLNGPYSGEPFLPPNDMFFIEVMGIGTDGFPLKRMTHTAISAQKPAVPIVTMKPRLAVPVGQNGTITCYVESLVPFTVLWLKDGEMIRERTSYKQTSDVFLQLPNMTEAREGSYACHVSNEEGSTSKQTKLRITGPPPIIITKEKIVTAPGENVEITCDVESILKYSISWFRYSGEKRNSKKVGDPWPLQIDSHININNLNKLVIANVKPEDEGWYACVVQNRGGRKEGNTYLHVHEPVRVVLYPTKVAFQLGGEIIISCRASGTPEPNLQWRKNGVTIEEEVEHGRIQITKDSSQIQLFIEDADILDDGSYECYAENMFDSDIGETIVEYQEGPLVIATMNQLHVPLGGSLNIQCDKTGIPVPTLKWYKNGQEIIPYERKVLQDDILKIIDVNENDSGDYVCEANNILGTSKDTVHVDIGNPPQIVQLTRDVSVDLNKNVSLPCLVSGYPKPIVSWGRKFQQDLPEERYLISTTGSLHIFDARVEDAGTYICSAENKFGSTEASVHIKITGIEKPVLDRSDNQGREIEKPLGTTLELPCRILIGNPPPKHIWYKDGTEIDKQMMLEDSIVLHDNGSLLVMYITHKHTGTYECVVTNAGGSVSRETFLRVTEAPQFLNKASPEKYALVGEDMQLNCDVRGEPKPLIMWEKDGLLLSPARRIVIDDDDDSLTIRAAVSSDKGIYTCVATNSAGISRRSTFLFMQSPPKISSGPQDLHAIEGQLLTLKCDVSAEPVALFTWWKNDKPLNNSFFNIQYLHQNSSIRFVATPYSQGKYTCVATNPAGKDSRDFDVSVMVPPNIYPPYEEQIAAMIGEKVTLDCQVFGSPSPKVHWSKDGIYLNDNNEDIKIGDVGTLTVTNITGESGGIYICDAENDVGVSQKLFYFSVNVPPKILEVLPNKVQLMEGEDFFLPCTASGYPFPEIRWRKDGRDILSLGSDDTTVHSDGTLMLLAVNQEHSGLFTCIAENKHGSEHRNYLIDILVPPSMIQAESSDLEVKEGESLVIACPAMDAIPAPQIDWLKDGHNLDPFSKRLVLEDGGRALKILTARPSDRGTYWCVATNLAGQSSASFNVDVITAPFFSDNSLGETQPRQHLVMVGKPVTFRCSVKGHPTPRVSWKKNNHPITVHTAPGVILSGDKQILHIPSVQRHDTGHYQCSVVNKVGSFYRDFELSVTQSPRMVGPMEKYYTILSGSDVLLQCPFTGLPEPLITWTKNGMNSFISEMSNVMISSDQKELQISSIKPSDSGIFSCEANNLAGQGERSFNITVLEAPSILQANLLEDISIPEGGSVSLECWIEGIPYPQVMWMHNGHILPLQNDLIRDHFNENKVVLHLRNLQSSQAGQYSCFASNEAGVQEKSFHVRVIVAPKMMDQKDNSINNTDIHSSNHEKIKGMPIILHCPVEGKPLPKVHWIKDSQLLEPYIVGSESTLHITNSTVQDSGNYTCLAYNEAGTASKTFQVVILDPPTINANGQRIQIKAGDKLILNCEVKGLPTPDVIWFKGASSITPELWPKVSLLHNNATLVLPDIKVKNSGHYSCLAINKIGTAEHNFIIQVLQAPYLSETVPNTTHTVKKNRRLVLKCFFEGSPLPNIYWFKDGKLLKDLSADDNIRVSSDNRQLHILNAKLEDSGTYKCKAENVAGTKELLFVVNVQAMAHWTHWGPWSECSVSCGPGEQIRHRTCGEPKLNDPFAQIECPGSAEEWQNCNIAECQVNGGWSEWSSWTSCSVSCSRGTRRRYRKCNNPVPMYGGAICLGSDAQQEYCHQVPCPINGQWSEWAPWTACSVTCDNGVQHRTRQCNNPPPMYGGTNCSGKAVEVINCNSHECPQDGQWSTWSKWSPCSTSCGPGNRQRSRECNNPAPKYEGNECQGENLQISHCTARSCDNIPIAAALHVHGKLNGEKLANSLIAANITDEGHKRTVQASTNDILKHQAGWFPYLTFMLSPISWNTAIEQDEANNGYSLTQGRFKQDSVVEFGSGEGLQLRHIGHGIDDTGVLRVDIEVHGQVPIIEENAQVVITPFEEDYVQTSPNSLFASAASTLKVNGVKLPYSWNNTVSYDSEGTMPYLVEKLSAQEVGVKYDPKSQEITSVMSTAIGRKYNRDTCPDGFVLDSQNMHCRDINECSDKRVNRCHVTQICENLFGTYRCSCEKGFRSSAIGKRCVDINECLQSPPICSHRCRNTRGSFKCQCPPGYTLLNDGRTCSETQYWDYPDEHGEISYVKPILRSVRGRRPSKFLPWTEAKELHTCPPGFENLNGICNDKNECKTGNLCPQNETCLNTKGSFRCLETPCPSNYERNIETGYCQVYCDTYACENGALLSQRVSYIVITPEDESVHPYQDLVQLSVLGDNGQQLAHTRYRITENESGKPFRVRFEKGQGVLYSLKFLPAGRIYRVTVLALSYDETEANILYTTNFIIFIYLPDD